jgi:hypothetical protein
MGSGMESCLGSLKFGSYFVRIKLRAFEDVATLSTA